MTDAEGDRIFDLDPTGMWKLFNDVQKLGFETASAVAKRFSALAEQSISGAGMSFATKGADPSHVEQTLTSAAQAAVDAYAELMQASWDAFNAVMGMSIQAWPAPSPPSTPGKITLPATAAGASVVGTFYVHNVSSGPARNIEITTGGLIGPNGALVRASSIAFDPATIEEIVAGLPAEVKVAVRLPESQPVGRYVGAIEAATDPATEIILALEVLAPAAQ